MRIRAVTPVITESFGPLILEEFAKVARSDTEISNVFVSSGPPSVESYFDEAMAVPGVVAQVRQAEGEGIDAVIINCMGDPGLDAAREVVSIPVIGPCVKGIYRDASIHI